MIIGEQDLMPAGNFLLPVCTNRDNLRKTLSILHFGVWEAGFGDDYAATLDILNALAFLDDPTNAPCYPTPAPLFVAELPNGFSRSNGALCIDMRRINVDINIIQEATFDDDHCGGVIDTSNFVKSEDGGGVSAIDINNLQQQIDALQSEIDNMQFIYNDLIAVSVEQRHAQIASMRWFPSTSEIPSGWVFMNGQRIDSQQGTASADPLILYARCPESWRDGTDVVLPNVAGFAVPGSRFFGFPENFGEVEATYTELSGTNSNRIDYVSGRWYIYIGDSVIS